MKIVHLKSYLVKTSYQPSVESRISK